MTLKWSSTGWPNDMSRRDNPTPDPPFCTRSPTERLAAVSAHEWALCGSQTVPGFSWRMLGRSRGRTG